MPSFKSVALGASALAFAFATLTAPALADDSHFDGVKSMDVSLSGAAPVVIVRNVADSKLLENLNLALHQNTITVPVGGSVECLGITSENWKWRYGYALGGGAFGIGRSSLLMSKDLPSSSSIDHVQDSDAHTFQMPANLLGNPQIGVDPVAEVLAAAEQAPDKLAWLRQDHVLTVKIPLRWEAGCGSYNRNKITKHNIFEHPKTSYLTRDVDLKIAYMGDPQLDTPKVNAQLGQGQGLPDQIDGGYQPFKITKMNFQPNMPHHIGACPATTTIRLDYEGVGRGALRLVIRDGAKIIDGPVNFLYQSKNGQDHYFFDIETPKPAASDLNKTVSHHLSVKVQTKDWKSQAWDSEYKLMDSAVWNVRCTPQVNPVLGGGAVSGAKKNGGNGGPSVSPTLQVKPAVVPQPASPGRVQAPTDGDPAKPRIIRRAQ